MDTTQNPESLHGKAASAAKTTDAFVNPQVPGALLGLKDLYNPEVSPAATQALRAKLDIGNSMNPVLNTAGK
jgi:hypothetical protein